MPERLEVRVATVRIHAHGGSRLRFVGFEVGEARYGFTCGDPVRGFGRYCWPLVQCTRRRLCGIVRGAGAREVG